MFTVLLLSASLVAGAATTVTGAVLFDFDPLAANKNSATSSAPGADLIEEYMEGLWGSDITVDVGAKTLKNRPEDPHPSGVYLGNSNGAPDRGAYPWLPYSHGDPKDTYLINRWDSTCSGCDRIVIVFEDDPITAAEFDWEIFPVNGVNTNADFTFKADGVQYFYTALTTLAEKQLGDLGHFSQAFPNPVSKLEFIDWNDAPIGLDNLSVSRVPGPTALLLVPIGFAGLLAWRRLRAGGAPRLASPLTR